jgi:lipopolysaccharide transport system permease protein
VNIDTGSIPYPVFVLTGTMFWQLFVDALNAPLKQLSANRTMLNRVNFPTEALLMSGMGQVLFSFAIKLIVLAVTIAAFQVVVHWTAVFLILPIATLLVMGTALGVLLAPSGMLYTDIGQLLTTLVAPLMFLTPVVYPPPSGTIGEIMHLNPLTPVFTLVRDLLYGNLVLTGAFALVSAGAVVVGVLAWLAYRLALPILVERMEA